VGSVSAPAKSPAPASNEPPAAEGSPPALTRPLGASLLGMAGGVLVAAQATQIFLHPRSYTTPNFGGKPLTHPEFAGLAFLEAIVLVFAGAAAYLSPDAHLELGVISITMAILSFYVGGGFFFGALLAYLGGLWAIFYDPTASAPKRAASGAHGTAAEPEEPDDEDPVAEADRLDAGRAHGDTDEAESPGEGSA